MMTTSQYCEDKLKSKLVGREHEMRLLRLATEQAADGRGSVWYVKGAAGIGKSMLVEQVANHAQQKGFAVLWGRCWEAGGAPAYWPWIQIIRELLRHPGYQSIHRSMRQQGMVLEQIIPELSRVGTAHQHDQSPEARFILLDTVMAYLREAARVQPCLIVLEDLHTADPSSRILLDFVQHYLQQSRVLLLATYRYADSELRKLIHGGQLISLSGLDKGEVSQFLNENLGPAVPQSVKDEIAKKCEGHPLFLTELAGLVASEGFRSRGSQALPDSIVAVIDERLSRLDRDTRTVLEQAAILGREFRVSTLTLLETTHHQDLEARLAHSLELGVVEQLGPGHYRFEHILTRDAIHQGIPAPVRMKRHLQLAETLSAYYRDDPEPPWAEIAHHYAQSGGLGHEGLLESHRQAGLQAMGQLAFEEAAIHFSDAIEASEALHRDDAITARLFLSRGQAKLKAGSISDGKADCREAQARAQQLNDRDLMARAALESTSVLVYGEVDLERIKILQEVLDQLGDQHPCVPQVMARLAAAMQPASDVKVPIRLAREAIQRARETGDPEILLNTIRDGCAALMDLAPAQERLELNQEHLQLATQLGVRYDAWRAHLRMVIDYSELGDMAGLERSIEELNATAESLRHPQYRWQVPALQAMRSHMLGRFKEAGELRRKAKALAEDAEDPNARRTLTIQRFGFMTAEERLDVDFANDPEWMTAFDIMPQSKAMSGIVAARHLLRSGRSEQAFGIVNQNLETIALSIQDLALGGALAEICAARGDRELSQTLYDMLAEKGDGYSHWGLMGMCMEGPLQRFLAILGPVIDKPATTIDNHFRLALGQAQETGHRAMVARIAHEYATWLETQSGRNDASERYRRLAHSEWAQLGIPPLVARSEALPDQQEPSAAMTFELEKTGDFWTLTRAGSSYQLKNTKGVQILSTLLADPRREFHVLDLYKQPSGDSRPSDGDPGSLLDDKARADYGRRVEELRAEIAEAEQWNDQGRLENARAELNFIAAELAKATGLGGRDRGFSKASERARVNVQRRIKDAIRRIRKHDEALATYLDLHVTTGSYCSFTP